MKMQSMDDIFYITSVFSDMKSTHTWSSNEIKVIMFLFKELSPYRQYFSSVEEIKSLEPLEIINGVPRIITMTRDEFHHVTGVGRPHLAREINKVRKSLSERSIHTPHPAEPKNTKSGASLAWFSEIIYSDDSGIIDFYFNERVLWRIMVFVKYARINFKYIASLKNHHAIQSYINFKILKDASKQNELLIDIDYFKEKLSISGQYIKFSHFKQKVLDVIESEINQKTDLELWYEPVKNKNKYTGVFFKFNNRIIDHEPDDDPITANPNIDGDEITYPIEEENHQNEKTILRSYGISVKAIEKYFAPLTGYKIEHIQEAITRFETEIARGKIIANKPAYFAKVLNSVVDDSQALLQAQSLEAEKQQRIEKSNKVKTAWDELDRYISSNEGYVLSIIDSFVRAIPVVSDEVIEVRDKITELYMVEDIGKIQIPFNSLSKVITALGEKWSIGAGNIMLFMAETKCISGDASDKIKALKESLAFHTDMIETVEDEKLKAHHKENVEKIKNNLLILLGVDVV